MRIESRRGFALVTTLLFLSVLVVMVSALFLVVRTKLFQSQTYQNQTAALYLAELAIADAMTELGSDPTWTTGFNNKTYPGVEGRYSINFNTGGAPTNMESVNNSDGANQETYRGPLTLLPGQCMLVATATVGQSTRTLEAIIDLGGGLLGLDGPLIVDGRIVLSGQASVDGVKSLATSQPMAVDLHSNLTDAAPDLVMIEDIPGQSLSGTVTIASSDPTSVNLGSFTPTGGPPQLSTPPKTVTPIDIAAEVSSKTGGTPVPGAVSSFPPLVGPVLPTSAFADVVRLDYSDGPEFYNGGSLTVDALQLNGASLYVDGDLTVNGGIEGSGSVWVTGNTTFRGTASITTSTPDKVALYSKGNVELQGFDGAVLLDLYSASSAQISESVSNITLSMDDVRSRITEINNPSDLGPNNGFDLESQLTAPPPPVAGTGGRAMIGGGHGVPMWRELGAAGNLVYRDAGSNNGGRHNLNLPSGDALLLGRAASVSRDFLIRRMFNLYEVNYGANDGSWIEFFALAEAKAGRLILGGVDGINDHRYLAGVPLVQAFFENFNIDYLGSSYFQGQIYTNGYFHSTNDVTVIGAIVTDVDPAARVGVDMTDSIPDPGDVILENGSRLLYVEDFFRPRAAGVIPEPAGVRLRLWMGR